MLTHSSLQWNADGRGFSLRETVENPLYLEGLGGSVEIDGRLLSISDAEPAGPVRTARPDGGVMSTVTYAFRASRVRWTWTLEEGDAGLRVSALLENAGAEAVRIGKWNVVHAQDGRGGRIHVCGKERETRFFAWHPWDMRVEPLPAEEGRHASHNVCHLSDPVTGRTLLIGFVTLDRMEGGHELHWAEGRGIDEYAAVCSFGSFTLPPGATLLSEKLEIGFHDDPYAALEHWADSVNRIYAPHFEDLPPVGWCGGGWIDAFSPREDCWEKVALDNARAVREKLAGFDVTYLWTSQANLKEGLPGNWLAAEETQIPSGYADFFSAQRALGFTPALWVSPFWFFSESEGTLEETRDSLLKDAHGVPICERGSWEFYVHTDPDDTPLLHKYYLDGTHPGALAFIRKTFAAYRELGVRYYMLDFLGYVQGAVLHDPAKLPFEAARSMLRAVRDAAGPDTHLQTAVSSTPGFIGLIDAARVGRDFGEGRPLFPPYATWGNAVYALHDQHFGNTHYLVQNTAACFFTHRKVYLNDCNLLTVDSPVPLGHARIAVTVFGLAGSPLMLGDDYRAISAERLRMVKMCLPRTRGVPRPVDLFDSPDGRCRVMKLAVDREWDPYLLAAVFNTEETPYATEILFSRLGLDDAEPYRVYEFWDQEYTGTFRGSFRTDVPPGSCRLYRIAKARPHPWILSTDMHVQQGAVELEDLRWDEGAMRLTGAVRRPAGESGSLFFLMPRTWRLVNHEGAKLMKDVRDMNVVIRTDVRFPAGSARLDLRFEPFATPYVSRKGWLPYSTADEWLRYAAAHRAPGDTRVME